MITIQNISNEYIKFNNYLIELNESIEINDYNLDYNILETYYNNNKIKIYKDNEEITFKQFVSETNLLTLNNHENLLDFSHNLTSENYFEIEKNANNQIVRINYYATASKTNLIKQEEIIRDSNDNITTIKTYLYKNNTIIKTKVEELIRDSNGNIINIHTYFLT